MAKRNQVTVDLKINADAQLKNSRDFINQLDNIIEKFDFGEKITNQFIVAKSQLKDYNKTLEKVQNKSLISDDELKDLVKAGKEIANIINKTEKLYVNLSNSELQKFSKEYINQIKQQEAEIAKIKESYSNQTGKNFDKELANRDKLVQKINDLKQAQINYNNEAAKNTALKEIEQLNQKLEQQKNKLLEIKKIQQASKLAYNATLDTESKKYGYNNYAEISNVKYKSEDQIRKDLGNQEYKEQNKIINEINSQIKTLEKNKEDIKNLDAEAIRLAKQYNINNVTNLNTLKQELKIKKDLLNANKSDKSRLANEQLVTEEYRKQNELLNNRDAIQNAAKASELKVIQENGYQTKSSLNSTGTALNRSITNLQSQLTETGMQNIFSNFEQSFSDAYNKNTQELSKAVQELTSIDETNRKISEATSKSAVQTERAADEQDVTALKNNITSSLKTTETNVDNHTTETVNNLGGALVNVINPATNTVDLKSLIQRYISDVNYNIPKMNIEYENFFDEINKDFAKLATGELKPEQLKSKVTEQRNIQKGIFEEIDSGMQSYISTLSDDLAELWNKFSSKEIDFDTYFKEQKKVEGDVYSTLDDRNILAGIENDVNQDLNKLEERINRITNQDTFKQLSGSANQVSQNLQKSAEQAQFLGSALDDFKNKVGYFLSMNYVFDQMTQKIREANTYIKELDKDMTQIGLVLGKTASQTWENFDSYAKMADRLSTTASDVTAAMKLFYQQGLNTVEVTEMVEASAIAAALGESTMAEASETLTSIVNSYNLAASQAIDVTDKISQVAIVSAADFGELSTAIEKVASSAASVGLDLDHLMGYLGKMIETTREAPTNIGTALKTIVANFAQFKEDPNSTTEDGTDVNKVDAALKSVGIQLLDTNGEMRDLGDVIDELGIKWKDLSRNTKSYLATMIAGTRQQSRFYALMNDYDRTLELVDESSQSSGKSTEQFAIYQDSLTAATQRLQNQWEKFYKTTLDGDSVLKNLNNALTSVLKGVNSIGPVWTTVFGITGIKTIKDLLNWINRLNEGIKQSRESNLSIENIANNIQQPKTKNNLVGQQQYSIVPGANWIGKQVAGQVGNVKNIDKTISDYEILIKVQKNLEQQQGILSEQDQNLIKTIQNKSIATKLNSDMTNMNASAAIGNAVATTGEKVAKDAATASTWGLYAAQIALTAGTALVGLAISAIVGGITTWINKSNELEESSKEALKSQQEEVNTLKDLSSRYEELNSMVTLSDDQHQELLETIAALGEEYPNLVEQYNAEGEAIKINNDLLAEQIKLENESLAAKAKNALSNTLNNENKEFSAYRKAWYTGSFDRDDGSYQFVGHTDLDNAIGDNAKAAFEEQQNQIETLVQEGKQFDLKGFNTAANIGELDLIDVLQSYAADLMSTEEALKSIEERRSLAIKSAKKDTDLEALNSYFDEIIAFVETSNNKIETANKKDIRLQMNDLVSAEINASDLTSEQRSMANNAINSQITSFSENMSDKDFANYAKSDDFSKLIQQYINEIGKITNEKTIDDYNNLLNSLNQENASTTEVKQQYNRIKDQLPDSLKNYLLKEIEQYDSYIDTLDDSGLITEDTKNKLYNVDRNAINQVNQAYNNFLPSLDESQQGQFKEDVKKLYNNTDFFEELGQLDDSNLLAVKEFKIKYGQALGQYGQDFLDEIISNPEYDAETIATSLTENQSIISGTGTTASGASMSDIATGQSDEGGMNILTSDDEFKAQNLLLIGQKVKVSAEEISDSYREAYKNVMNFTEQIITQAEGKLKTHIDTIRDTLNNENWEVGDNIDYSKLSNSEKEIVKNSEDAIINLQKQINYAEELQDRYQSLTIAQKANIDYGNFRNGVIAANEMINSLSNLAEIYDVVTTKQYTQLDLINWIANDTTGQLLAALEVENGQLMLNANSMEILAEAQKQEAITAIDAEIAKTEAQIAYVKAHGATSQQVLDNLSSVSTGQGTLSSNTATYMSSMMKNWTDWATNVKTNGFTIGNIINGLILAFNQLHKAEDEGNGSTNEITGGDTGNTTTTDEGDEVDNEIDDLVTLETLQDKLEKLKSLREGLNQLSGKDLLSGINNIGSYGDSGGSSGSEDTFEQMVEKLERFYNYLRQIEALESKINKIREKRNLIDATQNYYIKDLAEENKLLKEQSALYGNYIKDQQSYLADLRSQISKQFGNWAYFDSEGVVQVKQTEFTINSEEEQEKYESFSELLDEYQNEYNTMLENQNKLYEIQSTIIENINTSYDKVLQKITDISESLEYINSISEHKVDMSFGSVEKLTILSDKIKTTTDMLLNAQSAVNGLESDMKKLQDMVKKSDFSSLLTWDNTQQKYFVNNDKLNNTKTQQQFEKQGYNWEEIVTWVNAVAGASQKVTDSMKDTNEQLMSAREELKSILEDRLSTIDEIFDKATEEINKFYAIYEQKIGSLGTENELFGINSDNLDKQYNYLLITAQHAKALLAGLEQNRQSILDTLMKDYGDYVEMVDGVAYINKMAIEESSTLTEGQKADLLQLYQIYADSQDQIDEVNEKFYDYISQIKELEETKRDAIIDLKNRLYNELMRIDQQEINDLSEKYQKMSQLDSEYYSKLQQRISDARNARDLLQNQQNLAQMQNRLAILQQDNSGQYNAELVELQRQINEQLQAQADQNIDLELERIAREQEERQEDREMQITQMENLLTFKDENGMYWEQAQDIMNNGTASIIGKLMESDEYQKMSDEERQKALEELQDLTAQASAELSSGSEYITSNIREDLENLVKSPIEEIPAEIKTSSDTMVNQIKTATKTFINTMSALFKYLDELTGKNDANKWTSGILNNDGTYKMPTKKPAKKPTQSSSPSKNNSSKAPTLKVGSYVDVKTGTKWYYDSYGTAPTGYARSGKIRYINLKGSKPYNIEGLGWIAKKDIVGYSTGGYVDYTGIAAVHGKTGKPEAFLNAKQTALFETLRDALIKVPKIDSSDSGNSETINIENLAINVKELADTDSIDKVVKTVKDSIYKDATSGNNMKISRRR